MAMVPLESNPEAMNKFLASMGVPSRWQMHDVLGLEAELLSMVPKPVAAVVMLYPLTDKSEEFKAQQEQTIEAVGQDVSDKVFFTKQFVSNACGTVALIHAVANNLHNIPLTNGPLKAFLDKTKNMTPEERGHCLEEDVGIAKAHEEAAQEGQSQAPDPSTKMDTHFITLVNVDDTLYELDGRKKSPINHGSTSKENFLIDAANICRQFMDFDPSEARFAVVTLSGGQ